MQSAKNHLDIAKTMIQALPGNKMTATASMQQLVNMRSASKEANLEFDAVVDVEITRKAAAIMLAEKRWAEYASLCRCQEGEALACMRNPVGVWMLPDAMRGQEQAKRSESWMMP